MFLCFYVCFFCSLCCAYKSVRWLMMREDCTVGLNDILWREVRNDNVFIRLFVFDTSDVALLQYHCDDGIKIYVYNQ